MITLSGRAERGAEVSGSKQNRTRASARPGVLDDAQIIRIIEDEEPSTSYVIVSKDTGLLLKHTLPVWPSQILSLEIAATLSCAC